MSIVRLTAIASCAVFAELGLLGLAFALAACLAGVMP